MLRRHHRFFQSIQVIRDAAVVALAFAAAYFLRFSFPGLLPYEGPSPVDETVRVGLVLTVLWPLVGWASGLYRSRRAHSAWAELFDSAKVSLITFLLAVTVTYFVREVRFSRGVLVFWLVSVWTLVSAVRVASAVILRMARARGMNLRHVVVVGACPHSARVMATIAAQQSLGLRLHGVVAPRDQQALVGSHYGDHPVLGSVADLGRIVAERGIDQVIVALPLEQLAELKVIMAALSRETVDVRVVPDFFEHMTLCGGIEEFAGLPIINLQATPLGGWSLVAKRTFDIVAGGFAMLLALPVMLLVGLAVKLTSRGPLFYLQERVGMDGERFDIIKFRTMRVDAEEQGAQMTVADDPRRTPIGAFLRRLSLDELPQLWNVLRGDMSLVGPRPERPCFIEDFKNEIPRYALRHKIKAGITGWAQVHGMRGNTSIEKRIELDLYYIEHWSLSLDVKILIRTVFGGFLSRNAY